MNYNAMNQLWSFCFFFKMFIKSLSFLVQIGVLHIAYSSYDSFSLLCAAAYSYTITQYCTTQYCI